MTIDDLIFALNQAKEELGGEEQVRLHVVCNGNGDFLDINHIAYSKLFGLRCDVESPWWAYKNSK